jgi:hypothetical protein
MSDTVAVPVHQMKPSRPDQPDSRRRASRVTRLLPATLLLWLAVAPGAAHAVCAALPQPDGPVLALTADPAGQVLYVAGDFAQVGPDPRNHLAAIDLETCAVTGWDPNPNGAVRAFWLSEDGATLYLGGDFTSIGGQFRERLAAVSTHTGLPIQWTPQANDSVHALVPSVFNSSFYVGGAFTIVNGVAPRHGFVELTRINGFIASPRIDFGAGEAVRAIAHGQGRVYLAGDFTSVTVDLPGDPDDEACTERLRLAALELGDYTLSDWCPQPGGSVLRALRIAPDGGALYAGGDFSTVGDDARTGIVALDPGSAETLPWDPQLNGEARAILPSFDRSMLYLGGGFTMAGGIGRDFLAAVRAVDASVVDEDFGTPGTVCALHRTEDTAGGVFRLYAGGGHCDDADSGPAGWLAAFAAIPPEQQAPLTQAIPPGGLFNSETIGPITLECDDFGGSGCAVTYFTIDGEEPDTESPVFELPINLTSSLVLKFFSIDEVGNIEPVRTEVYEVETTAPVTTAAPVSRVFEESRLLVTLSCTDTGSGCAATYYTTDGTQPTTASNLYTGPITLTGTTVLQFFSVDVAGNQEAIRRQEYVRNRGEVGALSAIEAALALAGFWWWRRRRQA